jgi:type IV secretion system protein VirB4
MLSLKQFRSKAKGIADELDWAALVDDGVVLNKNGTLMAGYFYQGPDIASSTGYERTFYAEQVNTALSRLGNGWATWHDAVRLPASDYPAREASHFADPISSFLDEERRQQFQKEGNHFESEYALIFYYTPPDAKQKAVQSLIWEGEDDTTEAYSLNRVLISFRKQLDDIVDTLSAAVTLRPMKSYTVKDAYGEEHLQDELVNYLHFCLTGSNYPLNVPPGAAYLDAFVGGQPFIPGDTPKIGDNYIACVTIEGFPSKAYPNLLKVMEHLPIAYRWSTRMIYLDTHSGLAELRRYERKWKQKVKGFAAQVFKTQGGSINQDALDMSGEVNEAITKAQSGLVLYGYYTNTVVLMNESRQFLLENARWLTREVARQGFACRVETVNTPQAWHGSLPGHPMPNVRRPLLDTEQASYLIPLSSVWPGLDTNPCPFYPPNSPPLLYAATTGATPFRLNLHMDDLGHTLILGQSGAGKSVLLGTIAAAFKRYQDASITVFDKGYSMWALANATNGQHYDIAGDSSTLSFAPLTNIDTEADLGWALDWLESCYMLQTDRKPSPRQHEEMYRALKLLQKSGKTQRSLTDFFHTVQDEEIRLALSHYTVSGAMGYLLDAREDGLNDSVFTVFEMEELLNLGQKNVMPVLLYLFRRFEKSLKGQPALLILDEAWIMLGHPAFQAKIREWLKVLRKANCAVVMATQSISDLMKSGIFDVLAENCPTKIYLPNPNADEKGAPGYPNSYEYYSMLGLNDTEIQLIKTATPKKHYYYTSPLGRRLFDLGLGPAMLSFVAVSDKKTRAHLQALKAEHGDHWPWIWLEERGVKV